jgi:hypothetical protein
MILNKEQMAAQKDAEAAERKARLVALNSPKCETKKNSVEIPQYWKKKIKPNEKSKLWNELVSSAKSDPVAKDEFGEYRKGLFLYGCAMVQVEICENELWRLTIRSENPIGLPLIQAIRDKYIPDAFLMAMLFQDRAERFSNNIVQLYQLPNSNEAEMTEDKEKEVKNDTGRD